VVYVLRVVVLSGKHVEVGWGEPFCAASGSVLNINKCKGVTLGAQPPLIGHHLATGITFIDATTMLRHLGVLLTKGDARTAADEAWQKVVNAVRIRVSHWRSVPLTILRRAYVAKQLMASVITHLATFVDPPPQRLRDMAKKRHGPTPLPHLTVKQLTLRLVRLQALDRSPTTYSPGQAVLPRLLGAHRVGDRRPQRGPCPGPAAVDGLPGQDEGVAGRG
jgi:hypothetical protein